MYASIGHTHDHIYLKYVAGDKLQSPQWIPLLRNKQIDCFAAGRQSKSPLTRTSKTQYRLKNRKLQRKPPLQFSLNPHNYQMGHKLRACGRFSFVPILRHHCSTCTTFKSKSVAPHLTYISSRYESFIDSCHLTRRDKNLMPINYTS